ncbi:MAG: prolyl oligopeptidase family serine peptidase [archaeon]|nr:prolyl oligopeptidase family serine peptidase [archaeon]
MHSCPSEQGRSTLKALGRWPHGQEAEAEWLWDGDSSAPTVVGVVPSARSSSALRVLLGRAEKGSSGELAWRRELLQLEAAVVDQRGDVPFKLLGLQPPLQPGEPSTAFYAIDRRGVHSDTACLLEVDFSSPRIRQRVLFSHPRYDVSNALFDPSTGLPLAVGIYQQRMSWLSIPSSTPTPSNVATVATTTTASSSSSRLAKLLATLPSDREVTAIQPTPSGKWLVTCSSDRAPPELFLYDQSSGDNTASLSLCSTQPDLQQASGSLARTHPVSIPIKSASCSGDILLDGYLTLPPDTKDPSPTVQKDGSQREQRIPLVVMLHGGPADRDFWTLDPDVQLLALSGIAVFRPNYVGSSGYGKRFEEQAHGRLGTGVVQDVVAATEWLLQRHGDCLDASRVGVYGSSAGGFLALKAVSTAPQLFRCAATLNGVFSLPLLLESASHAVYFQRLAGFSRDPSVDQSVKQSVLAPDSLAGIKAPLLLCAGLDDDVVPVAHSTRLARALRRARATSAKLVIFPGEGHRFVQLYNILRLTSLVQSFMLKHLGGSSLSSSMPRDSWSDLFCFYLFNWNAHFLRLFKRKEKS